MPTKDQSKIFEKLENALGNSVPEPFVGGFEFDLSADAGSRVSGLVAIAGDRLFCFENGKQITNIPLCETSSFSTELGVGSVGVTYKTVDEAEHLLCFASASNSAYIAALIKRFNFYIKNGTTPDNKFLPKNNVCPKCHRPYLKGSSVCFHCMKKGANFKRLLAVAADCKWHMIASLVLFVLVTAAGLLPPLINRVLVDNYIETENPGALGGFIAVIISLVVVQLIQRGLSVLRGKSLIIAGNRVIIRLRQMVFDKVERLSIASISEHSVGQLMKRVTGDTANIRSFITDRLSEMLSQLLTIAVISIVLFLYDWKLALMILVPAPIVCLSFRFFWRFMHKMFHFRWELNSKASAILHDIFSGIRVVKSYGTEQKESARYRDIADSERNAQIRQEKLWAVLMPTLQFMMGFGEFVLLYYVGSKVLQNQMTLGEMSQFSAYVSMIYGPLHMLARLPNQILDASTSIGKVFDLIDETEQIIDSEKPISPNIRGEIEFHNVSFGYEDAKDVLTNIDIKIKPGEFIGLVGRSGVGKSTLINLVMRLYDADEGEILIDGVNIKDIPQDILRKNIGVVLQESFLFSGTVYQNIAFAKPEATREEIINAARQAGAHSFIIKLPDGYNTYIGERGHTLSGGERQRISIARALLRDPKILILDEATSALDTETEKIIQDAIEILSRQRTTIAIAHRLSTLRNATRLVVLDKGTVAETGTHDELMKKEGLYHQLVMAQREMTRMPGPPPH